MVLISVAKCRCVPSQAPEALHIRVSHDDPRPCNGNDGIIMDGN